MIIFVYNFFLLRSQLGPLLAAEGQCPGDSYHCQYSVLSVSTMQFFYAVDVGQFIGAYLQTSIIFVLHVLHSVSKKSPTSNLKARYLVLPPCSWTQCWQQGVPTHIFTSRVGAFSYPWSCSACASCPERGPWLGTTRKSYVMSLIGAFSPFIFKVIIDRYVVIAILLVNKIY